MALLQINKTTHVINGISWLMHTSQKYEVGDFLGGSVVKNPPANAGDMGLIPGLGRSHMPRSS